MEHLVVRVAGQDLGLDLARVREIAVAPPLTRVPGTPAPLRGLVALHGRTLPVVDLGSRLAGVAVPLDARTPVVVVEARLAHDRYAVALLVEEVGRLVETGTLLERPVALAPFDDVALCSWFALLDGVLVPILDLDAALAPASFGAVARRSAPVRERAGDPQAPSAVDADAPPPRMRAPIDAPAPSPAPAPIPASVRSPAPAPILVTVRNPAPASNRATVRNPAPPPAERPTAPRLADDRATHCIPVSPVLAVSKASSPEVSPPSAARPFTLPHLPLALGVETAPPPAYPRTAAEPTRSAPPPKLRRGAAAFAATALAIAIAAALLSAITAAPPRTSDTSSATALPTRRGADDEAAARGRRAPIASETPPTIPVAAVHPERGAGAEPPARARSTPAVETSSSTAVHPDRGAVAEAPPRGRGSCTSVIARGDTLWGLAARRLGDPERWREIFAANRDVIDDPDVISPGDRLEFDCAGAPLSGGARPRTP